MLPRSLFFRLHKVALFAIVFASLAPSISHALVTQQAENTFSQEICTADGRVITIQIVPAEGERLTTDAERKNTPASPASILHHLNHCPFCANPKIDHGMAMLAVPTVTLLESHVLQLAVDTQPALPRFPVLHPPAQAPPSIR